MHEQQKKAMQYKLALRQNRYQKRSMRREINKIRDQPKEMEKICQGKFAR